MKKLQEIGRAQQEETPKHFACLRLDLRQIGFLRGRRCCTWCQNALRCLTAPNCSWAYATLTFHYFGSVKTPEVILGPNFSWAYGALTLYYFGNVKSLKVMLRPNLSWACATLKSEWVAHFVFSFGAAAPKLNTPLALAQLLPHLPPGRRGYKGIKRVGARIKKEKRWAGRSKTRHCGMLTKRGKNAAPLPCVRSSTRSP